MGTWKYLLELFLLALGANKKTLQYGLLVIMNLKVSNLENIKIQLHK